jgi:hypothetical protein
MVDALADLKSDFALKDLVICIFSSVLKSRKQLMVFSPLKKSMSLIFSVVLA